MQTWQNIDKSTWENGPWQNEPDKAQWITAAGLDGLIVRGPTGALCGYVGVPMSHPCFKKDFDSINVEVHGGLTFSDMCEPSIDPAKNICHVDEYAANKIVWWLGFDCAHYADISPAPRHFRFDGEHFRFEGEEYRDFAYVKKQVEYLAEQLANIQVN